MDLGGGRLPSVGPMDGASTGMVPLFVINDSLHVPTKAIAVSHSLNATLRDILGAVNDQAPWRLITSGANSSHPSPQGWYACDVYACPATMFIETRANDDYGTFFRLLYVSSHIKADHTMHRLQVAANGVHSVRRRPIGDAGFVPNLMMHPGPSAPPPTAYPMQRADDDMLRRLGPSPASYPNGYGPATTNHHGYNEPQTGLGRGPAFSPAAPAPAARNFASTWAPDPYQNFSQAYTPSTPGNTATPETYGNDQQQQWASHLPAEVQRDGHAYGNDRDSNSIHAPSPVTHYPGTQYAYHPAGLTGSGGAASAYQPTPGSDLYRDNPRDSVPPAQPDYGSQWAPQAPAPSSQFAPTYDHHRGSGLAGPMQGPNSPSATTATITTQTAPATAAAAAAAGAAAAVLAPAPASSSELYYGVPLSTEPPTPSAPAWSGPASEETPPATTTPFQPPHVAPGPVHAVGRDAGPASLAVPSSVPMAQADLASTTPGPVSHREEAAPTAVSTRPDRSPVSRPATPSATVLLSQSSPAATSPAATPGVDASRAADTTAKSAASTPPLTSAPLSTPMATQPLVTMPAMATAILTGTSASGSTPAAAPAVDTVPVATPATPEPAPAPVLSAAATSRATEVLMSGVAAAYPAHNQRTDDPADPSAVGADKHSNSPARKARAKKAPKAAADRAPKNADPAGAEGTPSPVVKRRKKRATSMVKAQTEADLSSNPASATAASGENVVAIVKLKPKKRNRAKVAPRADAGGNPLEATAADAIASFFRTNNDLQEFSGRSASASAAAHAAADDSFDIADIVVSARLVEAATNAAEAGVSVAPPAVKSPPASSNSKPGSKPAKRANTATMAGPAASASATPNAASGVDGIEDETSSIGAVHVSPAVPVRRGRGRPSKLYLRYEAAMESGDVAAQQEIIEIFAKEQRAKAANGIHRPRTPSQAPAELKNEGAIGVSNQPGGRLPRGNPDTAEPPNKRVRGPNKSKMQRSPSDHHPIGGSFPTTMTLSHSMSMDEMRTFTGTGDVTLAPRDPEGSHFQQQPDAGASESDPQRADAAASTAGPPGPATYQSAGRASEHGGTERSGPWRMALHSLAVTAVLVADVTIERVRRTPWVVPAQISAAGSASHSADPRTAVAMHPSALAAEDYGGDEGEKALAHTSLYFNTMHDDWHRADSVMTS